MKTNFRYFLPILISLITFLVIPQCIANVRDSLYHPMISNSPQQTIVENTIATNYSSIQNIVPHLIEMQGQIPIIKEIIENFHKVEKLWGFYEEAKRDGTNLINNPLTNELAFTTHYTLYLLNESLDKIFINLKNEHLRVALVEWKGKKLKESKQVYQKDKVDLERLEKMKPSVMENPTISNTAKLANLLHRRDSLYSIKSNSKVLGEFRKNPSKSIEEVDLFYTCDIKKRIADNAPQSIMDFTSNKAIQVIRLDREIYQFRLIALAGLPYKEQQYFKLKKQLAVAANKEQLDTKRKFLKKKVDPTSHHSLILKDYNKLVNSFSFEEQNELREKEHIFNHEIISVIEFWGCREYFPSFYER